jgi:hypothetical protein
MAGVHGGLCLAPIGATSYELHIELRNFGVEARVR